MRQGGRRCGRLTARSLRRVSVMVEFHFDVHAARAARVALAQPFAAGANFPGVAGPQARMTGATRVNASDSSLTYVRAEVRLGIPRDPGITVGGSVLAGPCPQSAKYGAGHIEDAANWVRGSVRTTPRHDS